MSDISLTASMHSNLLSLQNTSELMDRTQERLSTGNKVNSALDNPSSYYTARSLGNRAGDLSALLDSMGQGISTVKAATESIESITSFVEQAKAVASSAREQPSREVESQGSFNDTKTEEYAFSLNGTAYSFETVESGSQLAEDLQTYLTKDTADGGAGLTNATAEYDDETGLITVTEDSTADPKVTTTFEAYSFKIEVDGQTTYVDASGSTDISGIGDKIAEAVAGLKDADGNAITGVSVAAVEDAAGNVTGFNIVSADAVEVKISGKAFGVEVTGTAGSAARLNYMDQYNSLLDQISDMARDASYKGVNLLQEDDLVVTFNEDRSSMLIVEGTDASAEGLGLASVDDWGSNDNVDKAIIATEDAINTLRTMAAEFGNNYAILQTREDFTESLINVLEEGADKLTLADMNEESANMLALQTRQQLAINSLSLASQASQAVLQLFS